MGAVYITYFVCYNAGHRGLAYQRSGGNIPLSSRCHHDPSHDRVMHQGALQASFSEAGRCPPGRCWHLSPRGVRSGAGHVPLSGHGDAPQSRRPGTAPLGFKAARSSPASAPGSWPGGGLATWAWQVPGRARRRGPDRTLSPLSERATLAGARGAPGGPPRKKKRIVQWASRRAR